MLVDPGHGVLIDQLKDVFDTVWATSWNEQANTLLAPLIGISALPVARMPAPPFDPIAKITGGVDHIVLASTATRELANTRCRRRGHAIDNLATGDKPLRQLATQAARVLHHPPSLVETRRPPQQPALSSQRRVDCIVASTGW